MKKLWAGWKVALLWFGVSFVSLIVIGMIIGGLGAKDPEKAGEELGRKFGIVVVLAPVAAYIIQKARIDHANRPAARRAQRDQEPPPPTA